MKHILLILSQVIIVADLFLKQYFFQLQARFYDVMQYQYLYFLLVYCMLGFILAKYQKFTSETKLNTSEKLEQIILLVINALIIAMHFIKGYDMSFLAIIMTGYLLGNLLVTKKNDKEDIK